VIKLLDQEAPHIIGCTDGVTVFQVPSDDCDNISVPLINQAIDDCVLPDALRWAYEIDIDKDGVIDIRGDVSPDSSGVVMVETSMPQGSHEISWIVIDPCGNETICTEEILVENSNAPVPLAHGAALSLGSEGQVSIWANDLSLKAEHPCTNDITYVISRADQDIEAAGSSLTFTCADIGTSSIKVYAVITLSDATQVHSATRVDLIIRDGGRVCDERDQMRGEVSGLVYLEDGRLLPEVELTLNELFTDNFMSSDTTGVTGFYELGEIGEDSRYYVRPDLNDDMMAGVSTLDIITIQRHIMGLLPLDSPYRMIASDINRDHRISISDMLQIRSALLFIPSDLDRYAHWRFIDDQLDFTYLRQPLEVFLPDEHYVTYDDPLVDMIAVKMGDVILDIR